MTVKEPPVAAALGESERLADPARPAAGAEPPRRRGCGWRHGMALVMAWIVVVCYADRTNVGIVFSGDDIPGLPAGSKGSILSAFFVGYMLTQIPGGVLARRFGAKPVMLLAAGVWTLFDVLTPYAVSWGFWPLYLVRVGMGLGEGLVFPTQTAVTCFWVPTLERGFLVTLMTAGQDLGSVFANLVSPIIAEAGAVYVFFFWASFAACWAVVFSLVASSAPELHTRCVKSGEAALIQEGRQGLSFAEARHARIEILPRRILCAPSAWAIFCGHVGQNYAWYCTLSWLPTFFRSHLGVELAQNPVLLAAPYLAGMFGGVFFGRLSDLAISRGWRPRHARKLAQAVSATGVAAFMQLAVRATTPVEASAWVAASLFIGKASNAGYWVNMVDVCPTSGATIMGISNTIATLPGILGQPITQYILDSTGSWSAVFGVGGAVALTAACIFALLGDDVSLDRASPA